MTKDKLAISIGLVAPIGVDLSSIATVFSSQLKSLIGVDIPEKKLTLKFTEQLPIFNKAKSTSGLDRYEILMNMGDNLRAKKKNNAAVVDTLLNDSKFKKSCYSTHLLHQFKTPEEVKSARSFFKKKDVPFFLIGITDTKESRINALSKKTNDKKSGKKAVTLIERDEKDQNTKWGQNVRKTFESSDFFIDASSRHTLDSQVERILKCIYNHPHVSPTKEEYGMYLAEGTAFRSRDLSRQVGAAILDINGTILSLGSNEAPRAFGGTYWEDDDPDNRDFVLGQCSSYQWRNNILLEFLSLLNDSGVKITGKTKKSRKISQAFTKFSTSDNHDFTDIKNSFPDFSSTRMGSIIEFGRSTHAEVNAITEAAKKGIPIEKGILYTTVFPCHICARYIISCGISEVIYIEAYPKSLTTDLYSSELAISPSCHCSDKVIIRNFIGVAPRIYRYIFSYSSSEDLPNKKDDNGKLTKWEPNLTKWISEK